MGIDRLLSERTAEWKVHARELHQLETFLAEYSAPHTASRINDKRDSGVQTNSRARRMKAVSASASASDGEDRDDDGDDAVARVDAVSPTEGVEGGMEYSVEEDTAPENEDRSLLERLDR
jgi:hypothetical protein